MFTIKHQKRSDRGAAFLSAFLPFTSKDPTRKVLQCVGIQGDTIAATNGHALLTGPKSMLGTYAGDEAVNAIPDGAYTVGKAGKDFILVPFDGTFPNVAQVLVKSWAKQFDADTGDWTKQANSTLAFNLARAGTCVSSALIDALPAGAWTVGVQTPLSPIHFHNETFRAVIMPMRVTDDKIKEGAFAWADVEAERLPKEAVNA